MKAVHKHARMEHRCTYLRTSPDGEMPWGCFSQRHAWRSFFFSHPCRVDTAMAAALSRSGV